MSKKEMSNCIHYILYIYILLSSNDVVYYSDFYSTAPTIKRDCEWCIPWQYAQWSMLLSKCHTVSQNTHKCNFINTRNKSMASLYCTVPYRNPKMCDGMTRSSVKPIFMQNGQQVWEAQLSVHSFLHDSRPLDKFAQTFLASIFWHVYVLESASVV